MVKTGTTIVGYQHAVGRGDATLAFSPTSLCSVGHRCREQHAENFLGLSAHRSQFSLQNTLWVQTMQPAGGQGGGAKEHRCQFSVADCAAVLHVSFVGIGHCSGALHLSLNIFTSSCSRACALQQSQCKLRSRLQPCK